MRIFYSLCSLNKLKFTCRIRQLGVEILLDTVLTGGAARSYGLLPVPVFTLLHMNTKSVSKSQHLFLSPKPLRASISVDVGGIG